MKTEEQTVNPTDDSAVEQSTEFKDAFILKAEVGVQLFQLLQELPIKYSKQILPLLHELEQAPRATIHMDPKAEGQAQSG